MRCTQHPTNNAALGAPPGFSHDECGALPITRVQYEDGTPSCVSFWQPSSEELAALNSGKGVRLEILGVTHAPVIVGVDTVPPAL